MLPSHTLLSSCSIPVCKHPSPKCLQRSSSASLSSVVIPAALQRSASGSVQVPSPVEQAHTHLSTDTDQASQRVAHSTRHLSSLLSTTLSPTKLRNTQELDFKANFGTAVRYAWSLQQPLLSELHMTLACASLPNSAHARSVSSYKKISKRAHCRTLRKDIPCTLQRNPNMDIFADNIAFTDNISPRMGHQTNTIQGVEAYSRQLWSLRFHAALLFSRSHVSYIRLAFSVCKLCITAGQFT